MLGKVLQRRLFCSFQPIHPLFFPLSFRFFFYNNLFVLFLLNISSSYRNQVYATYREYETIRICPPLRQVTYALLPVRWPACLTRNNHVNMTRTCAGMPSCHSTASGWPLLFTNVSFSYLDTQLLRVSLRAPTLHPQRVRCAYYYPFHSLTLHCLDECAAIYLSQSVNATPAGLRLLCCSFSAYVSCATAFISKLYKTTFFCFFGFSHAYATLYRPQGYYLSNI